MSTALLVAGVLAGFAIAAVVIGAFLVTLWRIPDR